ncbi:MAG: NYN domain-containing protein [Candidatus Roizmanbacteria bacterium]|nr:MAG: NYN domain-containing protein [Candidatus Roizmanbacteria bacterium]
MKNQKKQTPLRLVKQDYAGQAIYAFIDSQNVNLAIKDQGWALDFARFKIYLKDKYHVSKAYLFIGLIPGNQKLYDFLKKAGYILFFKPTLEIKDGKTNKIKGNVDAELVLHSMIEYPNYDKAIIVTGDGDFYCLVEYLLQKNKLLRVIIPNITKYSRLFYKFNPYLAFMNNLKNKLEHKKREASLRHESLQLSSHRNNINIPKIKKKSSTKNV